MEERAVSRIYYIDWLRILAVLLLFPFHTLRVFNSEAFYVKASPPSGAADWVISFIGVWHMPLLFFLAGCSTYLALRKRSAGQYAWERVSRLLVPLAFGILILLPPQTWYGARFNSAYSGSFWHYLSSGDYLKWNIQDGGDYYGGFGIGQLWFILWLFFISLILLPLVAWAARGKVAPRVQRLSRRLAHPLLWVVPILVLMLGEAAPQQVGKPSVLYALVFLLGFLVACEPRFAETAEFYRWPALIGGIALTVFWVETGSFRDSLADPSVGRVGLGFLGSMALWLMIMGAMGMGKRYLNRTSTVQKYLAEGSYPVYVIHQTAIVIIAFYAVDFGIPRGAQWVVLLVLAVAATFALYEIARRIGVLRFLLGMRGRRAAAKPGVAGLETVKVPVDPGARRPDDGSSAG
jgi:glucans biosynthesis protein C